MNGVIGEIDLNAQHAGDGRHGPVVTSVALPENGNAAIKPGELLFKGSKTVDGTTKYGATPAANANVKTLTATGDGSATTFSFAFNQDILPGSVKIITNDTTPQNVDDDGDGTLSDDATGTVDYANGKISATFTSAPANTKTVTATAIAASDFVGVNDSAVDVDDGIANVVVHGTIFEGIAKVDDVVATEEQLKFLTRHGIY